jgi:hypothetical protein
VKNRLQPFAPLKLIAIVIACFSVTFFSCSQEDDHQHHPVPGAVSEGSIEFNVTYPYLDSNDIGLNLLPSTMTMVFKNNKYRVESTGGMGLFLTGYVSDNDKKQMDYFLKIISQKFISRYSAKGLKSLHKDFPSYRLETLDSTRTIAGMECYGYKVVYYSNVVGDHYIWATDQIDLVGSNWCNPFPQIPGVMLAYQVQRSGLVINFEASKFTPSKLSDADFKTPLDYKVISNRALIRKMEEAFIGFEY